MNDQKHYAVGELAELGGISRRTVRFYVQEGLIPPPHGLGRGATYGPEHLETLLRVKSLQERGLTLDEIRSEGSPSASETYPLSLRRDRWTRIVLRPGVELHVQTGNQIPSPTRLEELAEWSRLYVRKQELHDD